MARFLDASIFLHAYLRPKRTLTQEEAEVKARASQIMKRVEEGEQVVTSVIHISEALNIVETRLGLAKALRLLEDILASDNIRIFDVTRRIYEEALVVSSRYQVSPNDGVAAIVASREGIKEIYSFDRHFDKLPRMARLADS